MAASLIEFESSRKKEAERNEKRQAREEILAKAEEKYERRKAFDDGRKQRGEDKWMLPSVNARLKEEEMSSKGKKAKKKKKHKKEKKHKKKSSASSPDGSEPEWVEAGAESYKGPTQIQKQDKEKPEATNPVQRDDWMLLESSFGPTYSRKDLTDTKKAKKEEEEKRVQLDKPGQHARELNPYWKDGGSGLPPTKPPETSTSSSSAKAAIGDGGLTWLQRAYQRAVEQAKTEGRSLEEIAAERWGSLEKLERLLAAAASKSKREGSENNHHRSAKQYSPPRHRRQRDDHYRMDSTSNKETSSTQFYRPTDNDGDDRLSGPTVRQPQRHYPDSRTRVPAWKNKEFVKKVEEKPVSSASSSQSSDEEEEEPPPAEQASPPQMMTDDDMNALSAKILKAELLGNEDEEKQLKAKLESARRLREFGVGGGPSATKDGNVIAQEEVVVLSRTDHRGMVRPLSAPEGQAQAVPAGGRRRKKQKVETHGASGSRTRYFADDDKYSLKQMFEREKLSTAEESNEMFARLAGKGIQKSGADFDMDEIMIDRASQKESDAKVEERQRSHAIQEHRRMNESMDSCLFCFGNSSLPKHLIISIAPKVYMCLPQHKSLTEGHCLLVPMRHISAGTQLDEDVWEEIQNFKKALTRMFEAQDQDVVFFESSMHLRRFPHMVLHCVPMPRDVGDTAPIYFKKAILESETEWSHNKKVVDLSNRDVRRAVPKGLPYFAVTFGLDGGFAHVIEDEQLFPKNFAQEIIGGILDLEPNVWRKPSRENFDQQRKKVLKFADWWKPYDWTSVEKD